MITFYKNKPDGRMRYYTIHDRQNILFARYYFTTISGIELNVGREKLYTFKTRKEMDTKLRYLFKKRINTGYKVLYSFSRKSKYKEFFSKYNRVQVG
jgi:hypothetical protein